MAGSAVIGALRVNLGIDTAAFTKGMASARKSLATAGKRMQSVGTAMSIGITAPVLAFGASIAKTAGDFEASMNKVGAVTSASADGIAAMRDQAKELGRTTQFSASQAANAMGFLGMAGFDTGQIIGAMPATLQLAAAAQMDLASAADIVSNVLSGYGMKVEDLARVNDVLVKTFTRTNTDLRQLGEAMKYAGPIASSAGVNFEEAAAALGLMGNAGIQASMAGTSLRGAISRILNPTTKAAGVMKDAGLSFTDASGRLKGLDEIVRQLEPHAEDTALFMEIFGQRAGPAMAALVSQGADALEGLTEELENAGGTAERIATAQMQGYNGAIKTLASAFEGLKLAIADSGLLEWLTNAVRGLTGFLSRLAQTSPELLKWGTIVAGLAAVVGPIVLAIGGLALALSAISLPVIAGIAAVVALGGIMVAFGEQISGVFGRVWSSLRETFGPPLAAIADAAGGVFQDLGGLVSGFFGGVTPDMQSALDVVKSILAAAVEFGAGRLMNTIEAALVAIRVGLETLSGVIRTVTQLLDGDFLGAWKTIGETVTNLVNGWVEIFQTAFDDLVALVPAFVEDFKNAFGGFKEKMKQVGRDFMQGFADGVVEKGSFLDSTIPGIMLRYVAKAKAALGSHSPSKVMHQVGVDTMLGFRNGIMSMQSQVESAAQATAAKVQEAVALVGGADRDPWAGLRQSTDSASRAMQGLGNVGQSIGSTISGAFKSVVDGSKTVGAALRDVLSRLADMAIDQGFQMLFGGNGLGALFGGGTGGGAGGLFGGIGKLFGFANGGSMSFGGGNNKMDNQLAAFRVSAGERVSVSRGDEGGGGTGVADVRVFVDQDGNWRAAVERISHGVGERITRTGIAQYDRQQQNGGALKNLRHAQERFG